MKNAIVTFIERHPIMTFLIVCEVVSSARDAVVGISRAITGNYPPSEPPKVDGCIHKPAPEEEPDGVCEEVSGDVVDILN